jgi:glutathione S-transferase
MAAYRLFGSTGSPYSVKVRSYMRFKGIPHVWLVRNTPELQQEHAQHAKLPLVPLVAVPDGSEAFQDSTPIIENFEAERPTPTIHPASVPLRFVSELLEEFADEWGNKWMFHYRWAHEQDGRDYARRIACEMRSGVPPPEDPEALESELKQLSDMFCDRMFGRLFTIGSTGQTRPIIEGGFLGGICMLEEHFADQRRPYLFGGRPSLADFGLSGQLWNCVTDPTAGGLMRLHAPSVVQWAERMHNPKVEHSMA